MILDVSKIIDGITELLEENQPQIDTLVNLYQKGRRLHVLKGERKTLPNSVLPALELEPDTSDTTWAYTRVRRADFQVRVILSITNGNEEKSVEYLGLLTTLVGRILTWPPYLQRRIPCTASFLADSGAKNCQYRVVKAGTIRVATFMWFGWVTEHYDNNIFVSGGDGLTGAPADALATPKTGIGPC